MNVKGLDYTCLTLSIIGAINWGLIGIFRFDLVAFLFGDNWTAQTAYKILALIMLFIGGLAAYTFVWDLGDVGIGLMTIFNIFMLYPLGEKALKELKIYESEKKKK